MLDKFWRYIYYEKILTIFIFVLCFVNSFRQFGVSFFFSFFFFCFCILQTMRARNFHISSVCFFFVEKGATSRNSTLWRISNIPTEFLYMYICAWTITEKQAKKNFFIL